MRAQSKDRNTFQLALKRSSLKSRSLWVTIGTNLPVHPEVYNRVEDGVGQRKAVEHREDVRKQLLA